MVQKLPVGLLWDSVSNNTGDKAIGLVAQRFCESRGIDYEVLNPFSYDPARYSVILVGGGELIRKRGDPFYDCYRVQGPHILNAAGLFRPDNIEYLRDYLLVTVRSEAERQVLQGTIPNAKVRPCIATLLGEFYPRQEASEKSQLAPGPRPNIGVHVHWGLLLNIPDVLDGLREINKLYHLTLIPFTLYNHDFELLQSLARLLPDASVSQATEPGDIYYSIGGLDGMIASSLHASIFALIQNVPVVAFPYAPKVLQHLQDRGLRHFAFFNVSELVEKVVSPEFLKLDYTTIIEQDTRSAHEHLEELKCIIDQQQSLPPGRGMTSLPHIDRTEQAITYHTMLMQFLGSEGDLRAKLIEARAVAADREQQLQQIMAGSSWKLAQFLRRLRLQLAPPGGARARAWSLVRKGLRVWRTEGFSSLMALSWGKLRSLTKRSPMDPDSSAASHSGRP